MPGGFGVDFGRILGAWGGFRRDLGGGLGGIKGNLGVFLGVGRSLLQWEQGLVQLPLVQGVLISSPISQRSPVEAVKVLAMQKNLLF